MQFSVVISLSETGFARSSLRQLLLRASLQRLDPTANGCAILFDEGDSRVFDPFGIHTQVILIVSA
jgi:hypothetical protein